MKLLISSSLLCEWFRRVHKRPFAEFFLIGSIIVTCLATIATASEPSRLPVFECLPWEVGQFVEYQIIHFENEGTKNRYKISLVGKETIEGETYFWEKIEIFEYLYYLRGELLRKNLTFLALVKPLTTDMFNKNMAQYIQNGFLPKDAVRLKVQLSDGPFFEVNPSRYLSYQGIIEKTPYARSPDAMGKIDFSRMKFASVDGKIAFEKVTVPAGTLECGHIFVSTDAQKEYFDEGFDLWRSPRIPLLGIVKMDFSKTSYWNKWFYRNGLKRITSISSFLDYLFHKRILGRTREDIYTAQLVDYGPKNKNEE